MGKGSSRPVRTYFFRPDRTNRSQVITEPCYNGLKVTKEKKHFSLTIFFSETIGPRRTGPGTQENRSGVIGKGSSDPVRTYFFRPDRTNRSRVITENLTGVVGKGSSRPLRPYFFRPDRTNRSRVITEPSYNGLKVTKEKKHFSLTIFFSETIGPRRTGPGSLERARHALYAHIFFVQIGLIGADTQENRSWVMGKGSSRPVRTYFFRPDRTNRSQVITKNLNGVIGKDSSRPLRPYFFRPDRTNKSRVITHPGEPVWGRWKGLVGPCTHIFFSSRSDQQEPSYNGLKGTKEKNIHPGEPVWGRWKGLVGPCTHIFFSSRSDQQEPSYNGLKGTKEKNIHLGEPDPGHGKGLVAPSTHIFFSSRSYQ
ncbi:hypothetical protein V1477_017844 [Vespula maculifrons]|uniref:Ribosomal protein L2 n=1 Tax=Vespula maculifrons TaxID=7453 RepID=A0ABD2AZY7_VESMC